MEKKSRWMRRFKPPRIGWISAAISLVSYAFFPGTQWIPRPYNFAGIVPLLLGQGIMIQAWWIFKKASTAVCPTERSSRMILTGPYKFSRNPMYLGMLLSLLGFAAILGNLTALSGPLFFLLVMERVFIPFEERSMEATFGDGYRDYISQVHRWI